MQMSFFVCFQFKSVIKSVLTTSLAGLIATLSKNQPTGVKLEVWRLFHQCFHPNIPLKTQYFPCSYSLGLMTNTTHEEQKWLHKDWGIFLKQNKIIRYNVVVNIVVLKHAKGDALCHI